ncbi:beta-lactamase family protein [Streptomyces sp. TRM66268-LWL]|uniref:Beta-lactamase family protein n=1 Tax=Streptomyces polyasparticus TaxID=2767826 RepID=A0ABR7SUY7_9ACTN|nr:serine hydrolase domain-containing protein [Streptomyces polyasparticus]MBC9719317.1 beta-lactamase family protein [Streptomyces polyasparticus]
MTALHTLLQRYVDDGTVPGAVALIARGDRVEVQAVGTASAGGATPMTRDAIFRIASITKPIVAAAVLMLIEDGRIGLDDQVARWLPELEKPQVVRTPDAPVDDTVPAVRPITVRHLLDFTAGYGFTSDFSKPALAPLFTELNQGPPRPQEVAPTDEWMAALARIPLLHQPGETWLYNTCSELQGVLIARVSGRSLGEFLAERIFEPLGMQDTGFAVPAADLGRFTSYYRTGPDGSLELVDAPDGQWSTEPAFLSGAGGLVSTVDDWHAFARMILAEGVSDTGHRLLSPESVRAMLTDQLTAGQRAGSDLFLEGQGWGYGAAVDLEPVHPWSVPGRYGWVGGTGTSAHLHPGTGAVGILLTQVELGGPTAPTLLREFWQLTNHAEQQ